MENTVVSVQMTEQEFYLCYKYGIDRRTGPLLRIIETVAMVLLFGYCLGAFIMQPQEKSSLFLAIASAVIGAMLWVVPEKRFRSMARLAVQDGLTLTVTVSETGLTFGRDGEEMPYQQLQCIRLEQMRILDFPGQLVGLPDRAFSEEILQLWEQVLPGERKGRRSK